MQKKKSDVYEHMTINLKLCVLIYLLIYIINFKKKKNEEKHIRTINLYCIP